MMETLSPTALTAREAEILRYVARGQTNPQIATQLGISTQTVKNHLTNIFEKLDTRSRTQAARLGLGARQYAFAAAAARWPQPYYYSRSA